MRIRPQIPLCLWIVLVTIIILKTTNWPNHNDFDPELPIDSSKNYILEVDFSFFNR